MDIGFIGLGAMGSAMARNLAAAGHTVRAWNRSPSRIEGVESVQAPANAFQADAVFTMLPDDASIRTVILESGVLATARPGVIHVVSSTISVAFAHDLAAAHAAANIAYIAAPVLGRPDVAAKGELNILAAGPPAAIDRVRPLLDVLGQKTWPMGDQPYQANAAKIAANMMITMAIEAMAEAVVITESNGVTRQIFFDLILNTLFGGRAYQTYSANIANNNYKPGFKATLGLKDLRLATEVAETAGKQLPMLNAVRGQMQQAVDSGLADKDWSVVAEYTIKN